MVGGYEEVGREDDLRTPITEGELDISRGRGVILLAEDGQDEEEGQRFNEDHQDPHHQPHDEHETTPMVADHPRGAGTLSVLGDARLTAALNVVLALVIVFGLITILQTKGGQKGSKPASQPTVPMAFPSATHQGSINPHPDMPLPAEIAPSQVIDPATASSATADAPASPLWATFTTSMDEETKAAQAILESHQNPEDCANAKYFMWAPFNAGMWEDMHTLGWAMGVALSQDRVLIYPHDSEWVYASPQDCTTLTPDCFFRPLSKCQGSVTAEEMEGSNEWNPVADAGSAVLGIAKVLRLTISMFDLNKSMRDFIPGGNGWEDKDLAWWRAQTTRYLVQPNPDMVDWAQVSFKKNLVRSPPVNDWTPADPPPESAICINVQQKGNAFPPIPFTEYVDRARELVTQNGAPTVVFLTADDEHVLDEAEQGIIGEGLTFYHLRYDHGQEGNDVSNEASFGRLLTTNMMLATHPSCQYFVETTALDWSRVVNEIRLTDGARQDDLWVDLEPGEWRH